MQVPIQLERDGRAILGMLHVPSRRADRAPVIVINYGLNGDRVDNHRLAVTFARRAVAAGVCVVRFDYTGCGVSDGEFENTSIATKIADTVAILEFVAGCFADESIRIAMLGYSDGIRVVHEVAQRRNDIDSVVYWNPIMRSMTTTFRAREGKRPRLEPTTRKLVFPLFGIYMGMDYLRQANADLEIGAVLDLPQRKLFAFGTGDTHTLGVQLELAGIHRDRGDFDILEIAGANHLFNRVDWSEQLIDGTIRWVLQTPS